MKIGRNEFDKLALEHLDMLYRIAFRLTRDAAEAEDLVQDTFVRAYRAREEFKLQEFGIKPWLVRILHNVYFSQRKREKRQPMTLEDAQLDQVQQAATALPADAKFNFDAMDQQVVRAIEEIPDEYQEVLLLWAIEEFSYKEISDALEVPIGTVMSRLYRARAKLAERLQEYAKKERLIRE